MESSFAPRFDNHQEPHPRQITFEAERVRIVLDRFGLSDRIPALFQRFEEKWGQQRLTFETFHEIFPHFPIVLEAHSFYHVGAQCRPAALFRKFDETFLLRRYLDVYARGHEEANGRPIGLVFPFDGFTGGMILHNGSFGTVGTKMIHAIRGDNPPHQVVAEPFIALVNYLARSGWTPATLPAKTPTTQRRRTKSVRLPPWLVRVLGCGPDTLVLGYLIQVCRSKSGHDRQLIRVVEGQRYVAIDHRGLARKTGLSPRQVKSGIRSLRDQRLIATQRRQDQGQIKTLFQVDWDALRRARHHMPDAGS